MRSLVLVLFILFLLGNVEINCGDGVIFGAKTDSSPVVYKNQLYLLISCNRPTWYEAKEYCEEMGGNLVCIESAEVQDLVKKLVRGRNAWIGATCNDNGSYGEWMWVNGNKMNFNAGGFKLQAPPWRMASNRL